MKSTLVALACAAALSLPAAAADLLRVEGVAPADALLIRQAPAPDAPVVAAIPPDAEGVAALVAAGPEGWRLVGHDLTIGWAPAAALAPGAGPDGFRAGAPRKGLAGVSWRLRRLGPAPMEGPAALSFTADVRMSGVAGCNRVNATFEAGPDGALTFGPAATTRRACPPPEMAVETGVLAALAATRRVLAFERVMALLDEEGRLLAQFVAAPGG